MGIALMDFEGNVLDSITLVSDEKTWGLRLADMNYQFSKWKIDKEAVTEVCCEYIKGSSNAPLLNCISGIIWYQLPHINLKMTTFIVPPTWKAFVRKKTGEKEPKGVASLKKFGYSVKGLSEDEADAILIGLCYLSKRRG
jgi:hypothetical protein